MNTTNIAGTRKSARFTFHPFRLKKAALCCLSFRNFELYLLTGLVEKTMLRSNLCRRHVHCAAKNGGDCYWDVMKVYRQTGSSSTDYFESTSDFHKVARGIRGVARVSRALPAHIVPRSHTPAHPDGSHVGSVERGEHDIYISGVDGLASALGVSLRGFFTLFVK
jgi:hypothetical protein